jgi:aspartate--ammonia ligase
MYTLKTVPGYRAKLDLRETERAIKFLKDTFERNLADTLCLERVSAPTFVPAKSGINDDLNGVERPVRFDLKEIPEFDAEIIHSLAKWKRLALARYGFGAGTGLYTDMNAIRRDDSIDNIHSVYVDQWDWEVIIDRADRTTAYLKAAVQKIASAIVKTAKLLKERFPAVSPDLTEKVEFISSDELYRRYPDLTAKERERAVTREHKTVFITGIGGKLSNGERHDGRAPDYDDWNLNGDLLLWNPALDDALEISSMGIRVDAASLAAQLEAAGETARKGFAYHKAVLADELPLTVGGGIGQSRLCMLLLEKLHIGEVQVSVWPKSMQTECEKAGIVLL